MGKTICFIGSNGHIGYALDAAVLDAEFTRFVLARGSDDDNMIGIKNCCINHGKEVVEYDNWRDILEKEKVDILVNCTVCAYMAEISIAFLEHGAHVFCEKPLARTLEELDRLEKAWKKSGKVLLAMLPFRYDRGFRAAYKAVREGVIGDVRLVSSQKSYKLGKRPSFFYNHEIYGGTIPWVGAHAIDFILFMSQKHMISAAAWNSSKFNGDQGDLDVSCACTFQMTDGTVATATMDYFRPSNAPTHGDDRVRAVGTEGILEVVGEKCYLTKEGTVELPDVEVLPIFQDFMNQVAGLPATMLSGEESIENARACLGARDAADENRIFTF